MDNRKRVLMSTPDKKFGIPIWVVQDVEKTFDVVWEKDFQANPEKFKDIVGIVFARMKGVPKEYLDALPNLKVVAQMGVGLDGLDIPLIRSYDVRVSNTPNVVSQSTADLGMALILNAGRNIIKSVNDYRDMKSKKYIPCNDLSLDVSETTLGIIGMGSIGYLVAKRAAAFDMKILYHNRNRRSTSEEESVGATYFSSLNKMLPQCDYVIIVVPLTDETFQFIATEQFKLMKKTSVLVNISRGKVVDTAALIDALKSGEIHSAALDVTDPEPLPQDHELLRLPNVIVTPHIATNTQKTKEKMFKLVIENLIAGVNDLEMPSEVMP